MSETGPIEASARERAVNALFRIPAKVMAGVVIACILLGLLAGGIVGGILLGVAVVILAAWVVLLWPSIPATERMLRFAVFFLVLALAIVRLT